MQLRWRRKLLHFKRPAATSRGALTERSTYIVEVSCPHGVGYGECCTMPGLLPEPTSDELTAACWAVETGENRVEKLTCSSPIRFGIESAVIAALAGGGARWNTSFSRGESGIPIHHLIWMADADTMLRHMQEGIRKGFSCLKLKVGALPWAQELQLLKTAREAFPQAEIRVDANGAFTPDTAMHKLAALAAIGIHSIEQPIATGQIKAMTELCSNSPLPIALDEELIHHALHASQRERLLDTIQPHALVIKPSLHGGLCAAEHWAQLAEERGIEWWVNSALESNIGRTALAEWCAYRTPGTLQALGTGNLFADDTPGPLHLQGAHLYYANSTN